MHVQCKWDHQTIGMEWKVLTWLKAAHFLQMMNFVLNCTLCINKSRQHIPDFCCALHKAKNNNRNDKFTNIAKRFGRLCSARAVYTICPLAVIAVSFSHSCANVCETELTELYSCLYHIFILTLLIIYDNDSMSHSWLYLASCRWHWLWQQMCLQVIGCQSKNLEDNNRHCRRQMIHIYQIEWNCLSKLLNNCFQKY